MIELRRHRLDGSGYLLHEREGLRLGFTEGGVSAPLLKRLFPSPRLLFLKQVHSDRIVSEEEWRPGIEADGLFLRRPGSMAVVQTADCIPLFFFREDGRAGGVVHVGWRGLLRGIEERLAALLGEDLGRYGFLLGPSIEARCYEVREEMLGIFADKPYGKEIFRKTAAGGHCLDLQTGLKMSLGAQGVDPGSIQDSGLCTRCSRGRFPSYRRDGNTGRRIFNFLQLRDEGSAGS
ncbi:MAG: polyphenol oxidase family protein [Candidatus Aminicenantes bacterium]|nr:polyphenol oxidase family protein [Candidatus Aminicenantes bacterium]